MFIAMNRFKVRKGAEADFEGFTVIQEVKPKGTAQVAE